MISLDLAVMEELADCYKAVDSGRAFQREQGFVQWTEEYPNLETLRSDITCGKGYAVKADGAVAGYLCIDFDGEPAYDTIDGAWRTKGPYAVVHRMAFDRVFRGMGLAHATFSRIEALCGARGVRNIRVDTDFPNLRMQHVLEKDGFVRCGVVVFQGSGKIAYDKILT